MLPPEPPPRCSEYQRLATPEEPDRWRWFSDGVGALEGFCPECAEREFDVPRAVGEP
jgi:hypothetical protein